MTTRRDFLKSLSATALLLPSVPQWDFKKSKVENITFPLEDDPDFWKKIRKLFPMPQDQAFFNTGTLGAMPTAVLESTIEHMRKVATEIAEWDYKSDDWISGYQPYTEIREKLGKLIGASYKEVALTENATMAMNYIANGLELNPGDEILSTDKEHSGGSSGWRLKEKRYKTIYTPLPIPTKPAHPDEIIEIFRKAVSPRTKVIAISHITSGNGMILPAKRICAEAKQKGIFTVIDGAQAVGQIAVNVKEIGCDAYFGSLHKWILSPPGTGFLYVKQNRMKAIWSTLAGHNWDNHEDDGFRLTQRGTGNLSLLMGLNTALDFHCKLGPKRVYARIKELGDYLREGLKKLKKVEIYTPLHPDMCTGITSYNVKGMKPGKLMDELWYRKKIRIRGIRQSTHIYNSLEELDATLDVLKDLVK